MVAKILTTTVAAPGFMGLNTQDSSVSLEAGYATVANNCVIDKFGRIGARKGWTTSHATNTDLGDADVKALGELIDNAGNSYIIAAGNNKLFKLVGTTLSQLTYGGGGSAPTITDSNWQMAPLNGVLYLYQAGHDPLVFDPAVSATTFKRISEKTGYVGTVPSGNVAIAAYGRLWVASSSTDKVTVSFSDLIAGHVWSGGTTGNLDTSRVWPNGADEVQALAAHNGFLFIFGKRQILVYQGATTPSTMSISDTVGGIGCLSRDSVQTTSSDVIFLSNSGVRSLMRTIQEKSAPERDLSKNVRNDLMSDVASQTLANIKSVYSEREGFYLLTMPVTQSVYCFDTKVILQDGSRRVTTWDSITPTALTSLRSGAVYIGKNGYIGQYTGYNDYTSVYRFQYYTNHADLGNVNQSSVLKKISVVVIGGTNQSVIFKWGFDFKTNYLSDNDTIPTQGESYYGIAEYGANATVVAQYSDGVALQTLTVPASGSGKVVQTGYESDINGTALSIQKIEIQAKNGKIS